MAFIAYEARWNSRPTSLIDVHKAWLHIDLKYEHSAMISVIWDSNIHLVLELSFFCEYSFLKMTHFCGAVTAAMFLKLVLISGTVISSKKITRLNLEI